MTPIHALLLGALQGLTEFLPISSSGHLALAQYFLELGHSSDQVAFDVVLHAATLMAVVLVYRESLRGLLASAIDAMSSSTTYRRPLQAVRDSHDLLLLLALALGSLPTAIIGLLFQERVEGLFGRPAIVASMLLVTGGLLLLPQLLRTPVREGVSIVWWQALLIGTVQGLAITPGISRSGSTISIALLLGIAPVAAARFSFLLSIPAILGALLLKVGDLDLGATSGWLLGVGFLTAFVVGWGSLMFLLAMLRRGRFALFAVYCCALGLGVLVWLQLAG